MGVYQDIIMPMSSGEPLFHFWEVKMKRPKYGSRDKGRLKYSRAAKKKVKKVVEDFENKLCLDSEQNAEKKNHERVSRSDVLEVLKSREKKEEEKKVNTAFINRIKQVIKIYLLNDKS